MLAAALYHALMEDGFDETGGVYAEWLKNALDEGRLTPARARKRAIEIVGEKAVKTWDTATPKEKGTEVERNGG